MGPTAKVAPFEQHMHATPCIGCSLGSTVLRGRPLSRVTYAWGCMHKLPPGSNLCMQPHAQVPPLDRRFLRGRPVIRAHTSDSGAACISYSRHANVPEIQRQETCISYYLNITMCLVHFLGACISYSFSGRAPRPPGSNLCMHLSLIHISEPTRPY